MSDFLIQKAIDDYAMADKNIKILVGFSGGPDSVCLLSYLYENGYNVSAAHMNHNMRETSLRDLEFCRAFCKERNIRLYEATVEKGKLKSELDARQVRYDFFNRIMDENGIDCLATAHNKNDCTETVLLHMIRGASTDGLCGIAPVNCSVIRPLIYLQKRDVYNYIREKGLSYVVDETNLTDIYSRNKLRNRIIPILEEEFNPSIVDVIADNSLLIAQDADFLCATADKIYKDIVSHNRVAVSSFLSLHKAIGNRVLQKMWKVSSGCGQNLSGKYISDIYKLINVNRNGSCIDLPGNVCASVEYGFLKISKKQIYEEFCFTIQPEKEYNLQGVGVVRLTKYGKGMYVYITEDDMIVLRSKRNGDRFLPAGMDGSKKVSDYFTDMRIPKAERCNIPILEINGQIAAVCGYRCDRRFGELRGMGVKHFIEIKK